jgi:hypothetical protein
LLRDREAITAPRNGKRLRGKVNRLIESSWQDLTGVVCSSASQQCYSVQ